MIDLTFMDDVARLLEQVARRGEKRDPIVFYGSSSFRFWTRMVEDLDDLSIINAGFGGATFIGANEHYEQVLKPLAPRQTFIYFGENDIANQGWTAKETLTLQQEFHSKLRADFPDMKVTYLGVKTGPSRWLWHEEFTRFNNLLAQSLTSDANASVLDVMSCLIGSNGLPAQKFFENDGIHVTPLGYARWVPLIRNAMRGED